MTALVIQDLLGGDLLRTTVNDGISHYWNRLPNGQEVDITASQFGLKMEYDQPPVVRTRDYVLSFEATRRRYYLLQYNMEEGL